MSRLTAPAKQVAKRPTEQLAKTSAKPPFPASTPATLVAAAVSLQSELDDADLAIQRTLTTARQAGVQKPTGVPSSVFEAGKLAKPARRPRLPTPTLVAPLAIANIERGIPIAPVRGDRRADQPYRELLAAMRAGDSCKLTDGQARALRHVANRLRKKITLRVLGDGCTRVWLLANPDPSPAAGTSQPTTGDKA